MAHACKNRVPKRIKGLYKMINECIRTCDTCQRNKPYRRSPQQRIPVVALKPPQPSHTVALDLMDMGPRTRAGNRILLVGVDLCSKFGYALPLPNKTSRVVAKAVETYILAGAIHIPKHILTDGGPEFRGQPFEDVLQKYQVVHRYSVPYHPQSNGAVERLNRTIKSRLTAAVQGEYLNWDKEVSAVVIQYNRTIHEETGRTPVSFYTEMPEGPILRDREYWDEPGKNFKIYKIGDQVLRKIAFFF